MAETKTYDFKQVTVSFGGRLITGFSADGITVAKDEDDWSLSVGADGETARSKSNNEASTVTIRLMQTSDANDILSGFYLADKKDGRSGLQPLIIRDASGRSLHTCAAAYVQKAPEAGYQSGLSNREWTIRCPQMINFWGGN